MLDILSKSRQIKNEADALLKEHEIIETLDKYGSVYFTGSYKKDSETENYMTPF